MPISVENKKLYPKNWKEISWQTRAQAGGKCELCDALNGKPHAVTGSKVVLTVHHLDYKPQNNDRENLICVCQRCHNRLDKWHRRNTRQGGKK